MKNKKVRGIILIFTLIFSILSQTNIQVYAASDSSTIDVSDSNVDQSLPTGVNYANSVFTISTGGSITVIGTTTTNTIAVATGVTNLTLTLRGTSITSSSKSPIDIQGNSKVNIVLAAGTTNTFASNASQKAGLSVPSGATVSISGTGTLNATGGSYGAGVGGGYQQSGGTINISSGTVNATGGASAAGIGGGNGSTGSGGTINISGGEVTAKGGIYAAGIGAGNEGNSGIINISGGTVTATGGNGDGFLDNGVGIGGGNLGIGGKITIKNANVTSKGGPFGAGIGSGSGDYKNKEWGLSGVIEIENSTVKATGGGNSAAIGGSNSSSAGNITIKNSNIEAKGSSGSGAAAIGSGDSSSGGTITIIGSTVTAIAGEYGAGIGGGYFGEGCTIMISESEVYATGNQGAAIGGGADSTSSSTITISGSTVTAIAGQYGAGIGGGNKGNGGTITINESTVKANGSQGAAIGGGYNGAGGTITISGSAVNAKGAFGAGIGGGFEAVNGAKITIDNSSTFTAISNGYGKYAIDAVSGSSGSIINAKLYDDAISTTTSSYIKLASTSLELPANYLNFAFSVTTDSTIKAYSDAGFNKLIGSIVKKADEKTLIPVIDLSVSPTSITQVKIATKANTMTVTAQNVEKTYDGNSYGVIATTNVPGAAIKYWNGSSYALDTSPTKKDVGNLTINFEATHPNYVTVTGSATVTINSKAVTVKAEDKTKVYGETDPALTTTLSGIVGEDTISYTLNRQTGDNVGTYTITPTGSATQGNYTVTYETATLTITKATGEDLTVVNYNGTYDGTTHSIEINNKILGDIAKYSIDGGANWTATNPAIINVGEYIINVNVENPNYKDRAITGTIKITLRPIEITAKSSSKEYDGTSMTNNAYSLTAGSLALNHTIDTVVLTGSQLYPGSSAI